MRKLFGSVVYISTRFDQYNKKDPWFMKVKIKHKSHRKGGLLIRLLGLPKKLFPSGFTGWADDTIQKMGVHSTTHIDAPWHYSPTVAGEKAKTIDQIPLDWCFGEGIVIDMKHKEDFDPITVKDIERFLEEQQLTLKPGMIVLIKTGREVYDFHKMIGLVLSFYHTVITEKIFSQFNTRKTFLL
jgi:hypothetical protein